MADKPLTKTKIREHSGVAVFLEHGEGCYVPKFIAEPEEGHELTGDSWEAVTGAIGRYFDIQGRKAREAGRKKLQPVPMVVMENIHDDYGVHKLVDGSITGIHSGHDHPIIKVGNAAAKAEGYSRETYLRPLSDEEKAEHADLAGALSTARKAYDRWIKARKIDDLKVYFTKHQAKEKTG